MWSVVCYPSRDLLMKYRHVFGRIAIITGQPHLGDLWYLRKSRTVEWFERPVKLGDVVGIHDSYFRIHTFHSILIFDKIDRMIDSYLFYTMDTIPNKNWLIHHYFAVALGSLLTIPLKASPWKHQVVQKQQSQGRGGEVGGKDQEPWVDKLEDYCILLLHIHSPLYGYMYHTVILLYKRSCVFCERGSFTSTSSCYSHEMCKFVQLGGSLERQYSKWPSSVHKLGWLEGPLL